MGKIIDRLRLKLALLIAPSCRLEIVIDGSDRRYRVRSNSLPTEKLTIKFENAPSDVKINHASTSMDAWLNKTMSESEAQFSETAFGSAQTIR